LITVGEPDQKESRSEAMPQADQKASGASEARPQADQKASGASEAMPQADQKAHQEASGASSRPEADQRDRDDF
jgi:hypothetical protein